MPLFRQWFVSRRDTERLMQWWDHPETFHGMTRGMKLVTLGTTKFFFLRTFSLQSSEYLP